MSTPTFRAAEMAEKIVNKIYDFEMDDGKWAKEWVAEALQQYAEEQVKACAPYDYVHIDEAEMKYQQARSEGYAQGAEDAAKIACDAKIWDGGVVCVQIRALVPKEGK